jgi:hypothetical protein
MAERYLTPDELKKARIKGITVGPRTMIDDETKEVFEPEDNPEPAPQVTPPTSQPAETDNTLTGKAKDYLSTAATSVAPVIAPALVGRAGAALAAAKVAARTGNPYAIGGAALAGGLATGTGAGILQDKVLSALEGDTGFKKRFEELAAKNAQKHPVLSTALPIVGAAVAGGGGLPGAINKQSLKTAGAIGGLSTGADIGLQKLQGAEDIDYKGAALRGGIGAFLNRGIGPVRNVERAALNKMGVPSTAIEHLAPRIVAPQEPTPDMMREGGKRMGVDEGSVETQATPIHQREGYTPDFYLGTEIENLKGMSPFADVVATLRKEGIPINAADLERISSQVGGTDPGRILQLIREAKRPMMEGNVPPDEAVKAWMNKDRMEAIAEMRLAGLEPNEADLASWMANKKAGRENKPANQAATDIEQNIQTGAPAAQPKAADAILRDYEKAARQYKTLYKTAKGEKDPEFKREWLQMLLEAKTNLDEKYAALPENIRRELGVGNPDVPEGTTLTSLKPKGLKEEDAGITVAPPPAEAGTENAGNVVPFPGANITKKPLTYIGEQDSLAGLDAETAAKVQAMAAKEGKPTKFDLFNNGEDSSVSAETLLKQGYTQAEIDAAKGAKPPVTPAPEKPAPAPAKPLPPKTPVAESAVETTVPETKATLQEQMALFRSGAKGAVLFVPGQEPPQIGSNEKITEVPQGKLLTRKSFRDDLIAEAVKNDELGLILGYGVPNKPKNPSGVVAVNKETPAGKVEVQSVAVTPETEAAALGAANRAALASGGKVEKTTPEAVIKNRSAGLSKQQNYKTDTVGLKPGDVVALMDKDGYPVNHKIKGIYNGVVGWENNTTDGMSVGALSNLLDEGRAILNPGTPSIPTVPPTPTPTPKSRGPRGGMKRTANTEAPPEVTGAPVNSVAEVEGMKVVKRGDGRWYEVKKNQPLDPKMGKMVQEIIALAEANAKPGSFDETNPVGASKAAASPLAANEGAPMGSKGRVEGLDWEKRPEGWFSPTAGFVTKAGDANLWAKLEAMASASKTSIGAGINAALNKNKEGGFIRLPFKNRPRPEPLDDRLHKIFPKSGRVFTKALGDTRIGRDQIDQPYIAHVQNISKGFSVQERERIDQFMHDMYRKGSSTVALSPDQQVLAKAYHKIIMDIAIDKSRPDSPWVLSFDPKTGMSTPRPFKVTPNYWMDIVSDDVRKILTARNADQNPEYAKLKKEYIDFKVANGYSPSQAAEAFNNQLFPVVAGKGAPNPEFRGLRFEASDGIPPSWREKDPAKSLVRYLERHATDMAWHRNIESVPQIAVAIGLTDNGRGVPYPLTLPGVEEMAGHSLVRAAIKDYVGTSDYNSRQFERLVKLATSPIVGTATQVADIPSAVGAFAEIANPSEMIYMIKPFLKGFTKEAERLAIASGSARANRNLNINSAQDMNDAAMQLSDGWNKVTGAEWLATKGRIVVDSMGRAMARMRYAKGDAEFFERFGPSNWRSRPVDEVVNYTAARITKHLQGGFDTADLPPALLRNSEGGLNQFIRATMSLQRWSVSRFNNWQKGALEPAMKGNLTPLLGGLLGAFVSAEVINQIREIITDRKPKELTWDEYLKLGGQDTAYTLFSKVATAGYAGIASDLAMGLIQASHKELPHGFNNMAYRAASDLAARFIQFGNAVADGSAHIGDVGELIKTILADRAQVIRILSQQDNNGKREEKIARRTGYLPEKKGTLGLPDPFSVAGRYRRGDTEGLARKFAADLQEGKIPQAPGSSVRTTVGPKGTFYNFVQDAQGPEAAQGALNRDIERTKKDWQTYSTAVSKIRR